LPNLHPGAGADLHSDEVKRPEQRGGEGDDDLGVPDCSIAGVEITDQVVGEIAPCGGPIN